MGRGKEEMRKRKREQAESEAFLLKALSGAGPGDGTEGGKNLEAARRALEKRQKEKEKAKKVKRNGGNVDDEGTAPEEERSEESEALKVLAARRKGALSAEAIRRIGFNPYVKDGKPVESEETKRQRVRTVFR